ncbi:hypothetical protein Bca52824_021490 [Brassica carinata]|uniref:Uncharacterized protein n=1 Tax=Brassica carinata TaxID=52824 RepID=A0A8X7VEH0_BRACI|nr:hypothetical protein Bca52824_021490 [Brassica carinata]
MSDYDRDDVYDMTRTRVGLEIQIGTKVKIVNGEDEESKNRDQSDMPRIRSTSGNGVSMESGFLRHLSFGLTTSVRLCFLLDFPQAAIIQRSVSELNIGFNLELHTSDRFELLSDVT